MLNNRLQSIVNRVDHLGSVSVKDLSELFGVAVETIRRDLRFLDDKGYIRRSHGFAVSLAGDDIGLAFGSRQNTQAGEKKGIAGKALELIKPGDVVMLDSSSSCWYLAQMLPDKPITVITNSLRIAFELVSKPAIKTLTIGGEYSEKYGAFLGSVTTAQLGDFRADILFCSCTGFEPESGAWESNELNAATKKVMHQSSKRTVLLCDSSKLGKSSLIKLFNSDQLDQVLSD